MHELEVSVHGRGWPTEQVDDFVVRVRAAFMPDAELIMVRDSVRRASREDVASALAHAGASIWEFA